MEINSKVGAGRFTLVRALGRGGMGEVWLAQDERLNEQVALKFLPPEVRADPVALDDLRRETARSHKLTHPNIVRIHDLHEEQGGMAFIAMEYVDGPTLAGLRLEQPERVLSWEFLRPLVQQLCAALDYAHGERVIHRDLKPANVMVDGKGRLKLADFGIAATVSDSVSRVSGRHATSGTLPYMSPQQLAGKHPQVADDIYALGATLYELLTSKPPFYTGDLTHQVLHEPPEPPDERLAALGIANAIPPDGAALVMACLAKEPAQRPQSARAVAGWIGLEVVSKPSLQSLTSEVFGKAESGESVGPLEAGDATPPPPRSRRNLLLAGVAAAALVLVALGGWYWTTRPSARGGHSAQEQAVIPEPDFSSPPAQPTPSPATATQDIPAPTASTPASLEPGFAALFNGHDLSGWDGDPRFWSVKQGCITGESSPGNIPERGTCLIWKDGVVDDFELRLSYKLITGNCGIQYRSKILDAKSWFVGGYQAHMADEPNYTGILYEERMPRHSMAECGEKVIWGVNGQKQVVGGTGKTQDELQAAIKQGDWNDYVIIARGNHLVHQINGNPMIEVTDSDPKHRSLSGIIALQIHRNSGKPTKVQFKDIRLKRLTKGPADPSAKAAGETTASRGSPPDLRPGQRWTNSLGMVFVTVPGTKVLFSIWETRVQDFDAFVNASGYQTGRTMYGHRRDGWKERNSDWRNPGFVQAADHPVVGVNWDDAQAFCRWLTAKEQSERNLDHNRQYRLPTDAEWSQAVGPDKFPWGNGWPPPTGAGNYGGEEIKDGDYPQGMAVIRDYRDGYARTSPVGSFRPNRFGLYDLGGNAWEWCFDWYRKEANDPTVLKAFPVLAADGGGGTYRVYRGGGWNDANGSVLLSANRMGDGFAESSKRYDNTGFRVVLGDLTEPANDSKLLPGVAPSETAVSSESSTTHPATSTKPQANAAATADWKRGLVLYFNFDEPPKGRVVRDESGLGNDGHVVGATWTARGRRGGAFAFHRTTNYIRVPNTASLNPPSLTAAAWIKTSYTDKTWRRIFDKDKRSSFALTILGDLDNFHPASRYRGHLGMVWASGFALSDNSAADGQWHHVATVADSSHIWTFVDGQMQHRVANSKGEVGKNDSPLYIGGFVNPNPKYSDIGQSFDGLIDEVMIFNRALSMEEVRQLYESP